MTEKDAFWAAKQRALVGAEETWSPRNYQPFEMPTSSAIGFVTAFFAVVTGFALIWHIWWMVGLGLLGAFLATLAFAFREHEEVDIPAERLARFDRAHPVGVTV